MSLYLILNIMVLLIGLIAVIGDTLEVLKKKTITERTLFNYAVYLANIMLVLSAMRVIKPTIDMNLIIFPTNLVYLYLLIKDIKIELKIK